MESNRFDAIVIGAGLAGLTAASVLTHAHLKVALVASGPGSFVFGVKWPRAEMAPAAFANPEFHQAISFFCEQARLAGSPLECAWNNPQLLPTVLGGIAPVTMAPVRLMHAALRNGSTTIVAGVHGLSCFDESFMAERLTEQANQLGLQCAYVPRKIAMAFDLGMPVTTLRLAQCFDHDSCFRVQLLQALKPLAAGADCILLPGMLGLHTSEKDILRFENELGCPVAELPTLPPSVPSLRLYYLLDRHLQALGVEFFRGYPAHKLSMQNGLCSGAAIASPGHPLLLRSESIVLAAGRHTPELLPPHCTDFDEKMRPLTNSGAILAHNLFMASPMHTYGGAELSALVEIFNGFRAGAHAAVAKGCYAAQ